MDLLKKLSHPLIPGLLLSAALAVISIRLGALGWLQAHGMSALTVAIVLGIFLGNTIYPSIATSSSAGVMFSKQTLLRAGVKMAALLPRGVQAKVNEALTAQGLDLDIGNLKASNLEEFVNHLSEFTVDVESAEGKVRVFCE